MPICGKKAAIAAPLTPLARSINYLPLPGVFIYREWSHPKETNYQIYYQLQAMDIDQNQKNPAATKPVNDPN